MLTFLVIVSRQPDYCAPYSRLPAPSQVTESPVVHPLQSQQVTELFSRNSFVLKTIHFDGVACTPTGPPLRPRATGSPIPSPIPFLFKFLRFFAFTRNSTLLFSSDSAVFTKNTRVGVGSHDAVPKPKLQLKI